MILWRENTDIESREPKVACLLSSGAIISSTMRHSDVTYLFRGHIIVL